MENIWPREDPDDQSLAPRGIASERQHRDAFFARFFELSLDLFCIANLEGYFLHVNPNFSTVLGHSQAELLARPFRDFIHPADLAATARVMQRLGEGQDVVRFRNRYRDSNGRYLVLEWTAKADGDIVYAAARNLSEQVQLEEEVLNARNREQAILDRTPAVIYVKGIDHRYQFINRQFAELFHAARGDIIGKNDFSLFPQAVAEQMIAIDCEVTRTGEAITIEELVPQDDGMHTYISVKFPLRDAQGVITAVAGISTDISDRLRAQQAEQELRLAQAFQRTLYPECAPEVAGLDIAGAAVAASHVCGDYYDFIPLAGHSVAISLGDVAGHGYKSALQMVGLRASLRVLLEASGSPRMVVEKLNNILCADFEDDPSFVSFFLATIDGPAQSLRYIGAGHDAFRIRADGRIVPLESTGLVLGVQVDETYAEAGPIAWAAGDVLVVFTDGFNEALNHAGEQFGQARVLDSIVPRRTDSARAMVEKLFSRVRSHVGGALVQDDMTAVVVKATE